MNSLPDDLGLSMQSDDSSSHREYRFWGNLPEHAELPNIIWLPVDGTNREIGFNDESGNQFISTSIRPFYIAKYLVTVSQFRAFEEAEDGWENPRWWLTSFPRVSPKLHIKHPLTAAVSLWQAIMDKYPNYNHPYAAQTWQVANAFCAWLSSRLGHPTLQEWLSEGEHWQTYPGVRLPTEWEWQWVASGEGEKRKWAFGNWDSRKANTSESGLSRTASVGLYPLGAARNGALDMSGNVWDMVSERDYEHK